MEIFSSSSSPVDGSLTLASAYFILVATEHFSLCNLTFSPFYSFIIDNYRLYIWFIYVPYQFLPLVVAMGTAEAAAAAPPTNGDPGSTCVAWRRRGRWWLGRPSPRVPYAVFPSLHLSHSARENPQSACTRHQQQATLHHWWVSVLMHIAPSVYKFLLFLGWGCITCQIYQTVDRVFPDGFTNYVL